LRPSYFLLINACIEIGCGDLGVLVASGGGWLDRPAVAETEGVAADTTIEVGEDAGVRAVFGSVTLQAAKTKAAGNTHSAFTQPVFALIKVDTAAFSIRASSWFSGGPREGSRRLLAG
jgi:hypothetical protein